ncbi:AAA family ATPase [Serratia sarumanii]|uniref:AAA family ATPase n=1 Tax=Serratia sarumanii TaxID=3020826 RepID=UPI003F815A00
MIRLERIYISGFKNSKSAVNVVFSPSNTSIIYGQNGCGKTSFLKILHAIFIMDDATLVFNTVNKVELYYSLDGVADLITIRKNYNTLAKSDDKPEYDWHEFIDSPLYKSSSLLLGVDRGVTNQPLKIEPKVFLEFFRNPVWRRNLRDINYYSLAEDLSDYIRRYQIRYRNRSVSSFVDFNKRNLNLQSVKMENIEELLIEKYRLARVTATKRIQSALFDTLSLAINLDEQKVPNPRNVIPSNFNSLVLEHADRLIEALDDGSENNFKSGVIDILKDDNLEKELDRLRDHSILSQLLLNMINELKLEKQMLSSINLLVDTFNDFLINDKELIVTAEKVVVKVGTTFHDINELSSGERHILTFLSLVLFEGGARDFLIIDEPEISLNLRWQRELMGLFSRLIPDTQIIVASHSPSLSHNNHNFLCELELKLG